jgi:hypothetical protein
MRRLTTAELARRFMVEFARVSRVPVSVFFTGGVTAILHGWRETTIDIDLKLVPDTDDLLREIPRLKEMLGVNVELASPDQFIPEVPGWRERSVFIATEGKVSYYHYDPYSQALSKIERGHRQDVVDVSEMLRSGLVEATRLLELFERIEPNLHRYPAIDPPSFRRAVEEVVESRSRPG